jgi:hypothetical protein
LTRGLLGAGAARAKAGRLPSPRARRQSSAARTLRSRQESLPTLGERSPRIPERWVSVHLASTRPLRRSRSWLSLRRSRAWSTKSLRRSRSSPSPHPLCSGLGSADPAVLWAGLWGFLGGVQPALAPLCCARACVCVCARARARRDRARQGGATRDCSKPWGRVQFCAF